MITRFKPLFLESQSLKYLLGIYLVQYTMLDTRNAIIRKIHKISALIIMEIEKNDREIKSWEKNLV